MTQNNDGCWLTPAEKDRACEFLLAHGLIKYDNSRRLPLKSGGMTDIYLSIRESRRSPVATAELGRIYGNPIFRLNPDRFVEVPDAVSSFAGHLSVVSGVPQVTIREQAKDGRATDAKVVGDLNPGETVVLLDDVITNGQSKIIPYRECIRRGVKVSSLVVLVDRQQGWQDTFNNENIHLDVWAGMTLHDVRKYLITHGIMQRCDPSVEEKNPLIVSLDGKSWEECLPLIDELRPTGCILKVNDLLIYEGSRSLLPDLEVYGRVMVDIKGHDIPNTLKNICRRLLECPPWAVTVHGSGGEEMISSVVQMFKGTHTKVLVVTLLTSLDRETGKEIYCRTPIGQVKKLASIAERAGADGIVCSPKEVKIMSALRPWMSYITPGVRSPGVEEDDQARVDTITGAMNNGSTNPVSGRQIINSDDPAAEVRRILHEELSVM